jgi:alkylglycerol monooxygenase
MLSYLFANIGKIGSPDIFFYGVFFFMSIYAFTELMDKNRQAWLFEILKSVVGFCLMFRTGDWFKSSQLLGNWVTIAVSIYLISTVLAAIWFVFYEFKQEEKEGNMSVA